MSTGEEQTSYSEADERLRAWQRKRRWNRRGLLPDLEGRMDDVKQQLGDMEGTVDRLEKLDGQLSIARQQTQRMEQAVIEARKQQRRDALQRLNRGRSALHASSSAHDEAMELLSQRRRALREDPLGDRSLPELEQEIARDQARLRELGDPVVHSKLLLPAIFCFILAVAAAAVYSALELLPLILAAAVFCVGAIVMLMAYSRGRQAVQRAREQQRLLLKKYGVSTPEEIPGVLDRLRMLHAALEEAERQEYAARSEFELATRQQSDLEESAIAELDFSSGSSEAARLSRSLTAARGQVEQLSAQMATLRGRLSAIGDPLVLSSSLTCMQTEYEQIQEEYDAITLALEALRDADREIQTRFSPQLGKVAAQYMSAVTGGRYEDVLINRDFSARTRTKGDAVARDAEYLSAGTLDLMYLAVRLAVCELALPEGEPCPLILDDALVSLDETRFQQAIELLKQIARERQVILFTCRQ